MQVLHWFFSPFHMLWMVAATCEPSLIIVVQACHFLRTVGDYSCPFRCVYGPCLLRWTPSFWTMLVALHQWWCIFQFLSKYFHHHPCSFLPLSPSFNNHNKHSWILHLSGLFFISLGEGTVHDGTYLHNEQLYAIAQKSIFFTLNYVLCHHCS